MTPLQQAIRARLDLLASDLEQLATQTALALVSNALAGAGARGGGRRATPRGGASSRGTRRSPGSRDAAADRILGYVKSNPSVRAEVVRAALGLEKGEWVRATSKLLADKKLSKRGAKRATTYSAGPG